MSMCSYPDCDNPPRPKSRTTLCDAHRKHLKLFGELRSLRANRWTLSELEMLKQWYADRPDGVPLEIKKLEVLLGRARATICAKAREFNLTNTSRKKGTAKPPPTKEELEALDAKHRWSHATKWTRHPHPRGMLGKKHSKETLKLVARSSKARWDSMSKKERKAHTDKARKAGAGKRKTSRGNWKSGFRKVGRRNIFFRSKWEFNYGLFLQFCKKQGRIKDWQHEPETFWFDQCYTGARGYLPDFKVIGNDGSVVYHEVKGWMCSRSKQIMRRMKKYYPEIKIVLIQVDWFKKNRPLLRTLKGFEPCKEIK